MKNEQGFIIAHYILLDLMCVAILFESIYQKRLGVVLQSLFIIAVTTSGIIVGITNFYV